MKQCYECKQEKEFIFFHKDRTKFDGYYTLCKGCRRRRSGAKELIRAEVIGVYKEKNIIRGKPYPRIQGTDIRAHRYIMEDVLGRKLFTEEHVHHIDGDRYNFSVQNLVVLYKSDHHKQHPTPKGDGKFAYCVNCGKEKWLNNSSLKKSYGDRIERYKLYECKSCGGGGRKPGPQGNGLKNE